MSENDDLHPDFLDTMNSITTEYTTCNNSHMGKSKINRYIWVVIKR